MKIILEFLDARQGEMCLIELEEENEHKGEKWICYEPRDECYIRWSPPTKPTTDLREAGRLLEGKVYVIKSGPKGFCGPWVYFGWIQHPTDANYRWTEEYGGTENLCRAITEAAVVAELTQMIGDD